MRIFLEGCSCLHHGGERQNLILTFPSNDISCLTHYPNASMYGAALLCKYELMKNVMSKDAGAGGIWGCNVRFMFDIALLEQDGRHFKL